MRARVYVTLKPEVLDPQGDAVRKGLSAMGFAAVGDVRVGKIVDIQLTDGTLSTDDLRRALEDMADRLLANPVLEDYRVEILPDAEVPGALSPVATQSPG